MNSRFLVALLLVAPLVAAHGAPAIEEYQHWIVSDFGTDATLAAPTGYEVDNVVFHEEYSDIYGPGVVIWLDAFGGTGNGQGEAFFLYEFDTPGGTQTFQMSTSDDQTFSGTGILLNASFEEAGYAQEVFQAYILDLEVFFPFSNLGVEIGDEISTMRFATAWDIGAGQWRFDTVPGGTSIVPLPEPLGSTLLIPEGGDETPVESFTLAGGEQHLDVNYSLVEGGFDLQINNPYETVHQSLRVQVDGLETIMTLPAGEALEVLVPGQGDVALKITSNIGGYYGVVVSLPVAEDAHGHDEEMDHDAMEEHESEEHGAMDHGEMDAQQDEGEPESEETPGLGFAIIPALAALVLRRRS